MPLVAGFKSELAANCPNCKIVQEINVGVTEWGTKIQPAVQSAVQAHPEINVVIPIYDFDVAVRGSRAAPRPARPAR